MIIWNPVIIDVRATTSTRRRKARSADDDVFSLRTEDTRPVLLSSCPVIDFTFSEAFTCCLFFISVFLLPAAISTAFFVTNRFEPVFFEAVFFEEEAITGLYPCSGESEQSAEYS